MGVTRPGLTLLATGGVMLGESASRLPRTFNTAHPAIGLSYDNRGSLFPPGRQGVLDPAIQRRAGFTSSLLDEIVSRHCADGPQLDSAIPSKT